MTGKTIEITRFFFATTACVTLIVISPEVSAQSSNLPPVTIDPPQQRTAPRAVPARRAATARRGTAARRARNPDVAAGAAPAAAVTAARETAYGRVDGYVASRSAAGTKTDTPLIETPQSISVVTRDQIEAQESQSIKQALRYTAGVAGENRANFAGYDIMYGRGFILDQYLDGMRLPGSTAQFSPQPEIYGMERVELLRGPGSMLFGQGSLGGLVNLVSRRPSEVSSNEVVLQGGSYDRIQGGFDSTGKLDKEGQFLYRVTGFAKDANNQVNFVKDQRYYIAPSLTWRPDKDTTWTVLTSYQKDPSVGYYNFVPYSGSLGPNPLGRIPTSFYAGDPNFNRNERETWSATSLFEHRFSDVFTVRQNTRYSETKGTLNQVFPLFLANSLFLNGDFDTLSRYAQATRERLNALTSDTQGEFNFWTGPVKHKVLVGYDNQTIHFDQRLAQSAQAFGSPFSAPDISLFNPTYGSSILNPFDDPSSLTNQNVGQRLSQQGVYLQEQMKIDRLNIVGGLRYDDARSTTSTANFAAARTDNVGQTDTATTGRIGAIYEFDNGVAPYATYATSFSPNVGTNSALAPLRPTTGELYEAGVKYQPRGSKIFVQASVFDLTQQNVLTIDPNTAFRSQIGEVNSKGFEIEGKASITDRIDLIASFSHTDAKVTRSLDVDLGKRPIWIPTNIAAGWIDYTFRDGPLNGFGAALGVRYMGQTWGDPANILLDVPSYTLIDAALHYDLEGLDRRFKGTRLSINATNLFDRVYVSQCTVQLLDNACVYGLRRQVLASLRYRW
ncbi:MAG: TonB-dependent siderophore receptor [Bradyrhizobium sp.]